MRNSSFRVRVVAVILGAAAVAATAVTLVLSASARSVLRDGYAERSEVHARIVAAAAAVPMAFDDAGEGAEILEQLAGLSGVRRAWILRPDGTSFAAWSADGAPGPPPSPAPRGGPGMAAGGRGEGLLAVAAIVTDGERLGHVVLDVGTGPIEARLAAQARGAMAVLVLVLGATSLLAIRLQRSLTRPISELVDLTRRIHAGIAGTTRAVPSGIPELAVLAESLNAMLSRLDERGEALAEANEQLEERVRARTEDLRRVVGRLEAEIHVRERVEAELRQASRRAEAANAAKSSFLANMSHEIRTPMTAILGFADLLLDPACDASMARDAAETIRRNGRHLVAIINDILDLSKIEAGRMEVERMQVGLPALLREVVELMQDRADARGLRLQVDAAGMVPAAIQTDPVRLRQVLVNLVGNAVKFTEAGAVTITVTYDEASQRLWLAVRDTGIGIDPQAAAQLFQPFAQADGSMTRRFGGTGLGLVISRRLAELLGGGIELESVPGSGSVFTVSIDPGDEATASRSRITAEEFVGAVAGRPCSGGEASERAREFSAATAGDGRRGVDAAASSSLARVVVLLVEDGPDNQRLIAHHLRAAGAAVHVRADGRLGVEAVLGEDALEPDLVVMDMQMPTMDGYEATEQLRRSGWNGPILALTAHAMEGDRERCLAAGCDDYLTKPIDGTELVGRVARLLPRRRAA